MWIIRKIRNHPVYSAISALVFIFIPSIIQPWWGLFTNEPMVPAVTKKLEGIGMPNITFVWLYWITIPLGFGMLGFIAYLARKGQSQQVPELLIDRQESELQFEIKPESVTLQSIIDFEDGVSLSEPPILEISVTFMPSQPMQFFKLHLNVGGEEIEPLGKPIYTSTLDLPYTIENTETHVIRFKIPVKFVSVVNEKKNATAKVVALVAGRTWESKEFDFTGNKSPLKIEVQKDGNAYSHIGSTEVQGTERGCRQTLSVKIHNTGKKAINDVAIYINEFESLSKDAQVSINLPIYLFCINTNTESVLFSAGQERSVNVVSHFRTYGNCYLRIEQFGEEKKPEVLISEQANYRIGIKIVGQGVCSYQRNFEISMTDADIQEGGLLANFKKIILMKSV